MLLTITYQHSSVLNKHFKHKVNRITDETEVMTEIEDDNDSEKNKCARLHFFGLIQSLCLNCLSVWCFTPYQQYFSYSMATVHKSMFP